MTRTVLAGDDLPDFVLSAFADHRRAVGEYPRALYVSALLALMMGARPGLWTPDRRGLWFWRHNLDASSLHGIDEFGETDSAD